MSTSENVRYAATLVCCMSGYVPAGLLLLFATGLFDIRLAIIAVILIPITFATGFIAVWRYDRYTRNQIRREGPS